MSKKLFKKLCLAFSIILACSFVPSMMMCNANVFVELGEIEVNGGSNEGCFQTMCGEKYGVKLHPEFDSETVDVIINAAKPDTRFKATIARTPKDNNPLWIAGCTGKTTHTIDTDFFTDPKICIINDMPEGTSDKFNCSIDLKSDKATCTSAASSLIAPVGAIIATILSLLVL